MIGNDLLSQLLAILIDRVFLALQVHLVLGVKAQLELEILDLQILDFAGLDRSSRSRSGLAGAGAAAAGAGFCAIAGTTSSKRNRSESSVLRIGAFLRDGFICL